MCVNYYIANYNWAATHVEHIHYTYSHIGRHDLELLFNAGDS